jgi:transcriptional regulator with GAF, ATPase, and Fis domain
VFLGESKKSSASVLKRTPLSIGAHTGPKTKYFQYDSQGNMRLADSFDRADEWWGARIGEYPRQPVIVGRTDVMVELFRLVEKLAYFNVSVIIQGETGTGKELVARALASPRGEPVPLNCSALPEALVEDELFGHVKGAFTGAITDRKGVFEIAHKGTLFLDEIGDMRLNTQAKLLRVLEDGIVVRVGSHKPITVDVRVICATNRDLLCLVEHGLFKAELYIRLRTFKLDLPPLRARKKDIPLLAAYFLLKNRMSFRRNINTIPAETLKKLSTHDYPWNVRELFKALERALVLGDGTILRPEHIIFDSMSPSALRAWGPHLLPTSHKSSTSHSQWTEGIREILRKNPGMTPKELATLEGCTERTVERHLLKLKQTIVWRKDGSDARIRRYYLSNGSSKLE